MFQFSRKASLSWDELELASCKEIDPELFFPDKGQSTKAAKKVCLSCDIRQRCLEVALINDERFGVFGGLSTNQRTRLLRSGRL